MTVAKVTGASHAKRITKVVAVISAADLIPKQLYNLVFYMGILSIHLL